MALKPAMGGGATGVDHTFGNALLPEVLQLFPQDEVLQQGGAAQAGAQAVVVIGEDHALLGGQRPVGGQVKGFQLSLLRGDGVARLGFAGGLGAREDHGGRVGCGRGQKGEGPGRT